MLISFSGAQSTGKSTLLELWRQSMPTWNFVPEITRLVKREYNLPINEQGGDLTQIMIAAEHLRNAYIKRDQHTILDRCSLDGYIYTEWLYKKGKVSESTHKHVRYVFEQTYEKYNCIIYTSPEDVPVINDGVRSADVKFREEIIELFEFYNTYIPKGVLYKVNGSIEQRMNQINNIFKRLGVYNKKNELAVKQN
jgi:nicotinamide riboside kinase